MPILSAEERVGRTLDGKYKVGLPIASGGMGVVYRGEHTWTGRPVAIKVLLPGLSSDVDIARRFLTEARASATIRHPNVVDVLDMGRDEDGSLYMVLELLEGRDLDDVIEERRMLSPDEAIAVLVPVLEGLAYAHEKGFVHRDMKPSNVFLSIDGRGVVVPKVLDFGIAKALDGGANKTTQTGVIVGTPHYMAPEQASGTGVIGPASDTWSVGVLLFEALSGELPFTGGSPTAILMNVLGKRAPSLKTVAPHLPSELIALVDSMLDPDADARPNDLAEHAKQLRRCVSKDLEGVLTELVHERGERGERAVAQTLRAASPAPALTDRMERPEPSPSEVKTKLERAPLPTRSPSWVPWAVAAAALTVAAGAIWWVQHTASTDVAVAPETPPATTEPTITTSAPVAPPTTAAELPQPTSEPTPDSTTGAGTPTEATTTTSAGATTRRAPPPTEVTTMTQAATVTETVETVETTMTTSMTTMMEPSGPTPITEVEDEW